MRILFKYMVWLLSFFSLVIFYLIGTTLGHKSLGNLAEDYFTKNLGNKIEIDALNLENYPYIVAQTRINDGALFLVSGEISREEIDIAYSLKGETFTWDQYFLETAINVQGTMKGKLSELFVQGEGEIFEGSVEYSFFRSPKNYENVKGEFKAIRSKSLLSFLKYDSLLEGEMDISVNFEHLDLYTKQGFAKVLMKEATLPNVFGEVKFLIDAHVTFQNLLNEFFADIDSSIGKLRVANGYYNRSAGLLKADYGLQIDELSYFEDFLDHKYTGKLNTAGSAKYEADKLSLKGDTTSYGGLLAYEYKHDYLDLDFKGVSLEHFLRQLSYPPLLSANVYGTASYDIIDEIILVNTQLKQTRFRRTKMTDTIFEETGIDILKDVYNKSVFTAGYQDSVLTSLLKIDNGVNHLHLKDTRMNSVTNEIRADFEVKLDGQEFYGDIDGTLDNPKVNLDMSKLIKYQINKSIDDFFGQSKPDKKSNSPKEVEDLPSLEMDAMQEEAHSFLNGFFE